MEDFAELQRKWLPIWESLRLFEPDESATDRKYLVDMFAYPSGDLHMGHAEAYALGDAVARYWIHRGHAVLHPVGWDSFGLPAENAAIKRNIHPAEWTYANIATQAATFRQYATSIDWRTRLHTSDPEYFRWTQWLFLRFFARDLAYRKRAAVNWCPGDQTVLANEQVVGGRCERCGSEVVQRELTQWFLRITAYADRLLDDMDQLTGYWPPGILTMQRNWIGRSGDTYRLRDWLVSRQRSWGCPIPIIHCAGCGPVAVPDDQLPFTPGDVDVPCPQCGAPASRDTDTLDTFVDSSWYFLRYVSPHYTDGPFDPAEVRRWLPVDQYIGGPEHAVLHLLYARFFTKVLHDLGLIDFDEPFRALLNQGSVLLNGAAMSKSKGNMVTLGDQIQRYGVDAVRLTMVFAGPPEEDVDWADVSPAGAGRFLSRALRLAGDAAAAGPGPSDHPLRRTTHRLLRTITDQVEAQRFNVAVARTMELVTAARAAIDAGSGTDPAVREAAETVTIVLSLFAPYTAEEMWSRLGHAPGVARARWPDADPELAAQQTVTCAVLVNGKVRARLEVPADITADELTARALASPAAAGKRVIRTIARPPALVNLLVN
ncbi:MAG: leucine--tRNA ligase [Actinoplanes sp.]